MIYVNIYAILLVVFSGLVKFTVNEKKVNAFDICLVRSSTVLVFSFIMAKSLKLSLHIEPKDRKILFWRSFAGTIGFTCMTIGVSMIPLVA